VPTIRPRGEDKLLELFLSVYEDRGWAGELSRVEYPERVKDGAVELIATQLATDRTLAIASFTCGSNGVRTRTSGRRNRNGGSR
jgi:hypothetical protein